VFNVNLEYKNKPNACALGLLVLGVIFFGNRSPPEQDKDRTKENQKRRTEE
jgi:hypothetical protein